MIDIEVLAEIYMPTADIISAAKEIKRSIKI